MFYDPTSYLKVALGASLALNASQWFMAHFRVRERFWQRRFYRTFGEPVPPLFRTKGALKAYYAAMSSHNESEGRRLRDRYERDLDHPQSP